MIVELHPDELFDKEITGELSPAERARLDAHLKGCTSCRFEHDVRADFFSEALSEHQLASLAGVVSLAALGDGGVSKSSREALPAAEISCSEPRLFPRARASRRKRAALSAVAGLAVATAALTGWTRVMASLHPQPTPTTQAPLAPAFTSRPAAGVGIASSGAAAAFAVEAPSSAMSPLVTGMAPTPAVPARTDPTPDRTQRTVPGPRFPGVLASAGEATGDAPIETIAAPFPAVARHVREPAPVDLRPRASTSAADLFARAGQARQSHNYDRALDLYRELGAKYPGSREAEVGHAIVAQILLDRGDATGALGHFDNYLSQEGPLSEDALVGRARALARLGKRGEEASAWTALLAAYPHSVHATRARAQLAVLGTP